MSRSSPKVSSQSPQCPNQPAPNDVDVDVVDVVVDVRGQVQSADANRGGARLGLCLCRGDLAQAYMDGLGADGESNVVGVPEMGEMTQGRCGVFWG